MRRKLKRIYHFLLLTVNAEAVILLIINIIIGVLSSFNVIVWKRVIDSANEAAVSKDNTLFIGNMIILCLLSILSIIFERGSFYIQYRYTYKIDKLLTEKILKKSNELEYSRYYEGETYDVLERLSNEGTDNLAYVLQKITTIIKSIASTISVIIIIVQINVFIISMLFVLILPILFLDIKFSDILFKMEGTQTENKRRANKFKRFLWNANSIAEIRIYDSFSYIKDKIIKLNRQGYVKENKFRITQTSIDCIINSIYIVSCFIIKIVFLCVIIKEGNTIGTITMYISSLDLFTTNLQQLVYTVVDLNGNALFINLIFEFLENNNFGTERKSNNTIINNICSVKLRHVTFRYNENQNILCNVSFEFEKGKVYILCGENGSGKSTLLKVLLGLYKPQEGKVLINSTDINNIDIKSYYKKIGVVFQEFNKYPTSVYNNISFNSTNNKKKQYIMKELGLHSVFSKYKNGYNTILDNEVKDGEQLSLGQWQRIAIGRMQYKNADFLILDEPTASLDIEMKKKLIKYISDNKEDHITILVSHESNIFEIADEIIFMEHGKLKKLRT